MDPEDGESRCPKRRNIFTLRSGCLPQKIAMNHAYLLVGHSEILIPFFTSTLVVTNPDYVS
jgi:hypothetical protein